MPAFGSFGPVSWPRVLLTLLLALAAALLCVWLRTPIPWMIGPLLATALGGALGKQVSFEAMRRQAAERGWGFLAKPVRAPALRALVSQTLLRQGASP